MGRTVRSVLVAALLPIAFVVGGYATMAVFNEVANGSSAAAVTGNWAVLMVFGLLLYLPGVVIAVIGGAMLTASPRAGKVVATVGLVWMSAVWLLLVVDAVSLAVDPPPQDGTSWVSRLSLPETVMFAVPFVLMTVANVRAAWVVWARQDTALPVSDRGPGQR